MKKTLRACIGGWLILLSASSGLGQGSFNNWMISTGGSPNSDFNFTPISFGSYTNLWTGGLTPVHIGIMEFPAWPTNLSITGSAIQLQTWTGSVPYSATFGGASLVVSLRDPTLPLIFSPVTTWPDLILSPPVTLLTQPTAIHHSFHGKFRCAPLRPAQVEQELEEVLADLTLESHRQFGHHRRFESRTILIEAERLTYGVPGGPFPPLPPTELTPSGVGFSTMPIPEPGVLSFLVVGSGLLAVATRRKRNFS